MRDEREPLVVGSLQNFREWETGQPGLREKPLQMGSLSASLGWHVPPSRLDRLRPVEKESPPTLTAIGW